MVVGMVLDRNRNPVCSVMSDNQPVLPHSEMVSTN
jgi:hypothetical protein